MRLRHRPSTAADFQAWLQYSTVRSRYGPLFGKLPEVWGSLLSNGEAISSVVEDLAVKWTAGTGAERIRN
jgi:hypothetical protein